MKKDFIFIYDSSDEAENHFTVTIKDNDLIKGDGQQSRFNLQDELILISQKIQKLIVQ